MSANRSFLGAGTMTGAVVGIIGAVAGFSDVGAGTVAGARTGAVAGSGFTVFFVAVFFAFTGCSFDGLAATWGFFSVITRAPCFAANSARPATNFFFVMVSPSSLLHSLSSPRSEDILSVYSVF